jgi:hypothetical protein
VNSTRLKGRISRSIGSLLKTLEAPIRNSPNRIKPGEEDMEGAPAGI